MRIKVYFIIFFLLASGPLFASHISGGELFYEHISSTDSTDTYKLTMRLFRECNSNGQILNSEVVNIGVYFNGDKTLYTIISLNKQWNGDPPFIQNTPGAFPCLTQEIQLCYQIGIFTNTVELPKNKNGYLLSWIRCCRQLVTNVVNTPYPDSAVGATFTTSIPGTSQVPNGFNNSPQFVVKDTILVCAGKIFTLDFGAIDKDGDSLVYSLCDAYSGAIPLDPDPIPPGQLVLNPLPYTAPYSGSAPLGPDVTINAATGIISGKAPGLPGKYVVNVCVQEYRHDTLINVHHKDFILTIGNCGFASAELNPDYLSCGGFSIQLENQSTSPLINSYYWDFGEKNSTTDTSTNPQPYFTYSDSGTYVVKLVVNRGGHCGDSTTTLAKIYPGFVANFGVTGVCIPMPYQFIDSSVSKYGTITSWLWNFGDSTGTSTNENPTYAYTEPGIKNITLITTNSYGCTDTVSKSIPILNKLIVQASGDTTICAGGSANINIINPAGLTYSWYPASGLSDASVFNPVAAPAVTTVYYVNALDAKGCKGQDSVLITVNPKPVFALNPVSSSICRGDTLLLTASGGDIYQWSPSQTILNNQSPAVQVMPLNTTTYQVNITSNSCHVTDTLYAAVNITPRFPLVVTKSNDIDCFAAQARLFAAGGTQYSWYPAAGLDNPNVYNPVATLLTTTTYYVTATNSSACVEKDSIQVKVLTNDAQNGYYMASAFTPNNDGVNDCFGVRLWGGIKTVDLSVYDRWGNKVFYTTDPSKCWDGTYKGIPQASGTFVYQVRASTICGNVYRKGTVVLIR